MYPVFDLECDLMSYCLKYRGRWWANHFFRNRTVNDLYAYLRRLDVGTVIAILGSGYESHVRHISLAAGFISDSPGTVDSDAGPASRIDSSGVE